MKDIIKEIERKRKESHKKYGKTISTRVSLDLDRCLEQTAKVENIAKSKLMQQILADYFCQ